MKTVDQNYRYDELEGFEPLDLTRDNRISSREICMTTHDRRLHFSGEARKTLFTRKYIRFSYNREQKKLLVLSCPDAGKDTVFLPKSAGSNGLSCAGLRILLEQELRYDLSVVRIRIPGEPCRSRPNGFIFDLNQAVTMKPQKKEKKQK